MSHLQAATSDQVTVPADETLTEQFWEIVCADDGWLRAEFDEIVTAGFSDQGAAPRRSVPRPAAPPPGILAPAGPPRRPPATAPVVRARARQRSPPPAGSTSSQLRR
ncbi:hypothetical protein [Ornithinimicrobium tianjinense]|uniref:Uncharacterized protein n=1 Tax=Ornithinimicrobium tianjinense TaxID=1195761 RepID=A0A917FAA7_9MICO|nr:hypothetical protein [Ornithinimicrobium tianjinense]GGF57285.1 hypothetical protein GCM10011366_26440 [Ornithinimicrobium tianjinense]